MVGGVVVVVVIVIVVVIVVVVVVVVVVVMVIVVVVVVVVVVVIVGVVGSFVRGRRVVVDVVVIVAGVGASVGAPPGAAEHWFSSLEARLHLRPPTRPRWHTHRSPFVMSWAVVQSYHLSGFSPNSSIALCGTFAKRRTHAKNNAHPASTIKEPIFCWLWQMIAFLKEFVVKNLQSS